MKQLLLTVLLAQPILGPGMEWNKDQWLGMPTSTESLSGEDWYYDIKPYYEGTLMDGFAGAGNDSKNFDDDLVIKVYNECSINTAYITTGINPDIDVTGTYNINVSTEWATNKKVRGIIQVNPGATLTIDNNAIIEFADSKSASRPTYILVKRGGRLFINQGATLTGNEGCNAMWDGIYVEGTYGTTQPTAASLLANGYVVTGGAHGLVKIEGGATIQNARYGINLGLPLAFGGFPNYGGGILIADDANFINNSYDVIFYPFDKTNVSFIRHSDFLTNAVLKDEMEIPQYHIYLSMVKNVTMRGNHFENSVPIITYSGINRGNGVGGMLSGFKVQDNPASFGALATGTTGDPNSFVGLYYGVYGSQGPLSSDNIVVEGNIFTNNIRSIYLGNAQLVYANRNAIIMNLLANYGIYLDASTGYTVQENSVTGTGALSTSNGIVINQSGTATNTLYRNTVSGVKYGVKIQGNNGNATNGLELKCNNFASNKYDISLISQGTVIATMKKNQGYCGTESSPANNLFTDPSYVTTVSGKQIFVSPSGTINYYYYTFNRDLFQLLPPFAAPSSYANEIDPALPNSPVFSDDFGCTEAAYNESNRETAYCPTNFLGGGGGRMANPTTSGTPIRQFDPLNPYHLAKVSGDDTRAEERAAFIDNEGFNLQAGYYMKEDFGDSLSVLLETNNSLLSQSVQASVATDSASFSEAADIIDDIEAAPAADPQGYSAALQNIAILMVADTLTWLQISNTDLGTIETISTNDDREGVQAALLMEYQSGINYEEPLYELDDEVTDDDLRQIQNAYQASELNTINIYPNPVSGTSIIEINLETLAGNDLLIVTDMRGKRLMQFAISENISYFKISNKLLPAGTYIGYVQCDGCKKLSKQIIVL